MKKAADQLRKQTEDSHLDIIGEAMQWAEETWPKFLDKLQDEAAKGLRSSRQIILPPEAPEDVLRQLMLMPAEMLKALPTPVPRLRARMAALMARAEAEGLKVERLAPSAWEVKW